MAERPLQWQALRAALDPALGSEQAGDRPVLIVSHESINIALPIVTVLPMTTHRPGRRVYSTEVLLPAGMAGQPQDSIVMAHQIRTISKERLRRSYGWLLDEDLREQIRAAMRVHLDLE
jgi:mRNA interferase MazF